MAAARLSEVGLVAVEQEPELGEELLLPGDVGREDERPDDLDQLLMLRRRQAGRQAGLVHQRHSLNGIKMLVVTGTSYEPAAQVIFQR